MAHAVMQLADSITKAKLAKHLVREQIPPTKEFVHEVISGVGSSPTVSQGYPTPGAADSHEPTYRVTPPPEGLKRFTKQCVSTLLMRGVASD